MIIEQVDLLRFAKIFIKKILKTQHKTQVQFVVTLHVKSCK